MKEAGLFLLVVALISAQSVAFFIFGAEMPWPDFGLALAVYAGLKNDEEKAAAYGMAIGFLQDCLAYGAFGMNIFLKGMIAFGVSSVKKILFQEMIYTKGVLLAVATLIDFLGYLFIASLFFGQNLSGALLGALAPQLLLNILFGLLLFATFDKLDRLLAGPSTHGERYRFPERL